MQNYVNLSDEKCIKFVYEIYFQMGASSFMWMLMMMLFLFGFMTLFNILGHQRLFQHRAWKVQQILLRGSNFGLRFFYVL